MRFTKLETCRVGFSAVVCILAALGAGRLEGQRLETVRYDLRPGSAILDDCLDCDRVSMERPLRGSFLVTLEAIGNFTDWHSIRDLEASTPDGEYRLTGGGDFTTHYTVPLSLGELSLELTINDQAGIRLASESGDSSAPFPSLDVRVRETGERDPLHVYSLRIVAARETEMVPYVVEKGSYLVDDCTICGRPSIQVPVEGTFLLGELWREFIPARVYRLDALALRSASPNPDYRVLGTGVLSRWSLNTPEPVQQMSLEASVNDGPLLAFMSTEDVADPPPFPRLEIRLRAEAPDSFLVYTLHLLARPENLPVVPFVRADVNDDGSTDIADAVAILFQLFVADLQLGCDKSIDVDDSGQRDVSDAIALLHYLFRAFPAPPSPFGDCGDDPTPDLLGCARFAGCN